MDEEHLLGAIRRVSFNTVRARLVELAGDWSWSSVRAHLGGRDDGVVTVAPVLERVGPFIAFVDEPFDEGAGFAPLPHADPTRRPVSSEVWVKRLENQLSRPLAPRKRRQSYES